AIISDIHFVSGTGERNRVMIRVQESSVTNFCNVAKCQPGVCRAQQCRARRRGYTSSTKKNCIPSRVGRIYSYHQVVRTPRGAKIWNSGQLYPCRTTV